MLHACYLLFILCMSVKSSMYVVLTMPTLNKAYLFIYLFMYLLLFDEHAFNFLFIFANHFVITNYPI